MKECHFEQPFAIFGIYPVYLKKLIQIKMNAVTIATINYGQTTFCWQIPAKISQELEKIKKLFFGRIQLKCNSM